MRPSFFRRWFRPHRPGYIYLLRDYGAFDVEFLGMAHDPETRFAGLLDGTIESFASGWVRSLLDQGRRPVLQLLIPARHIPQDAELPVCHTPATNGYRAAYVRLDEHTLAYRIETPDIDERWQLGTECQMLAEVDKAARSNR